MTPMRDYPHLPLLTIAQCLGAFSRAGIPVIKLHLVLGVSRQTLYKWRTKGTEPYSPTLQAVSTLAYKCLRALAAGLMPPPGSSVDQYRAALSDSDERMELLDNLKADELLALLTPQNT